ncbi:hypothetical protein H7X65_01770 [Candidatus Parcubacteria bacterium]|nr:hypothetical protein [Candidatus Parcubacteria bacterium]
MTNLIIFLISLIPVCISWSILTIGSCWFCIGLDKIKITMTSKGDPPATTEEISYTCFAFVRFFILSLVAEICMGVSTLRFICLVYSSAIFIGTTIGWLIYSRIVPEQDMEDDQ